MTWSYMTPGHFYMPGLPPCSLVSLAPAIRGLSDMSRPAPDRGHAPGSEAEAVWEKLRGTRWNPPPAAAADAARRRTHVFALEQAEQMFRAAAGTGVGDPAAAGVLRAEPGRAGHRRRSSGRCRRVGAGRPRDHLRRSDAAGALPEIQVQPGKEGSAGSFVRLSELLGSPLWPRVNRWR